MLRIIAIWVINALALLALPYVFSSIHVESFGTALLVALVLGLINTLLRPLLVLLTLPVTLLTLGLFIFVINALLFRLADYLVSGFDVLDKIGTTPTGAQDRPITEVKILDVIVESKSQQAATKISN